MQKSAASFLRPLSFFLGCCDPPPPAQQPGLSWFLGSWAGPARCPCLDHVPSGWDPQQVDLGVCLGAPPCSSKDRFDLFRGVAAKFSLESPALTPLLSQNCCLAISAWASLQRRCFQREPYSPTSSSQHLLRGHLCSSSELGNCSQLGRFHVLAPLEVWPNSALSNSLDLSPVSVLVASGHSFSLGPTWASYCWTKA